jgi:hypothetical protein
MCMTSTETLASLTRIVVAAAAIVALAGEQQPGAGADRRARAHEAGT